MDDTPTILVVDDNETVRHVTVLLLRQAGHRVIEAATGEQGLSLAAAHHPNIVLLDVVLPDLDGLEVCRRIRANPALADVFVVLASSFRTSSDQQALGLWAGADGYVPRPVGNAELLARVDAFLRIRRTESALRQQEKLAAVATLAAGAAHEINNPLMGIMGYAELLQERLGSESPLRECIDEIMREAQRVATIVRSLGSFADPPISDRRWQAPAAILREFAVLMKASLRAERVRFEIELPAELPEISCSAAHLRQVLLHLLSNAREALSEKYPGVHPDKVVLLSARPVGPDGLESLGPGGDAGPEPTPATAWLRITLDDHGSGLPEEIRAAVFEPFFTTKSHPEHSGLGLATSRRILQEHGGRISLESVPGQWTRVHVDLPARWVSSPP